MNRLAFSSRSGSLWCNASTGFPYEGEDGCPIQTTNLRTVASQSTALGTSNPRHGLPCDEVTCGDFFPYFSFLLGDEAQEERRQMRDDRRVEDLPRVLLAGYVCNLVGRGSGGRSGGGETACGEAEDAHRSLRCLCASNRSPTVRCTR